LCVFVSTYYSGDKIKKITWAEHVASMGGKKGARIILVEKSARKRPLGKPRRRKYLKETCWVWTGLIWLKIWRSGGLL